MDKCQLENLKQQIFDQFKSHGYVNMALCEELMNIAEKVHDDANILYAHIWIAESYFEQDKFACLREIEKAKVYIDESKPSELLEKYYSIQYMVYASFYDTQAAFYYCLKSLKMSEYLYENTLESSTFTRFFIHDAKNRVAGNYGNVGINFFNQGLYQNALMYCKKALNILNTLEEINVYAKCLLLLNIILSSLRLDLVKGVMILIEQLKIIPMEAKELKIYVDYAYLNYAIYKRDKKNILFYTAELLNDDIEQYGGHLTAIDFYIDLLPFYIELGYHEIVTKLFDILSTLINVDEIQPLLKLSKLKILFSKTFHDGSLQKYYQEYYALYLENEKFTRKIKVQGLNTRLKANEITIENVKSKKQIHDLKKMIHYDELTNVYNRRYLKLKYNEIFARRKKRIISIAIIDVDYFKEYNDYYGHLAGDAILKIIAVCLKDACRDQMLVCRYGGDEFLVLCWDNDAPYLHNYLLEVIENIRKLNIPHSTSKCAQQLTLSIGYGIQEMRDQSEILSFFEKVDKALYASKEKGRNQVNEID